LRYAFLWYAEAATLCLADLDGEGEVVESNAEPVTAGDFGGDPDSVISPLTASACSSGRSAILKPVCTGEAAQRHIRIRYPIHHIRGR
jgi:hypothetical protein